MGLLFAYGAVLGIRWVYVTDDLRELVSGHLSLHVNYVRDDIGNPPSIDNALAITETVPVDIRIFGPDVDWASDPDFPAVDELVFGNSDVFSDAAGGWLSDLDGVEFAEKGGHGFLRIAQGAYSIIVSTPKIADTTENRSLTPIIMGFGLLLVFLSYLAVRWLFKPIRSIRYGAAQIGRGNFQYRITNIRRDQLGDLADDINRMAQDVQRMLDAKRQLLFGISHELRTPLSRMKLGLELSASEDEDLRGLRQDVEEMEKIIGTLLEAEKLNTRHAAINITRVSARELVDGLLKDYFSRDIERLETDIPDDVFLNVDEARVTLLLKNLVSNALRYSDPGDGPIRIEVSVRDDAWVIKVRDQGPGISPDQAEFIGEPFYRGDPSRTRHTGGSGLGLYIARLVAEAHGGTLELDHGVARGACFVVTFPFEPDEQQLPA
jgi:signal transduction histidine kinase